MHRTKLKTTAISLALAAVMTVPALAASNGGAIVNTDDLNLRAAPSTSSTVVSQLSTGECVVVCEKVNDQWYKVVYNSKLGYLSSDYITYYYELLGELGYGTIYGSDVRLRESPSLDAPVVGVFPDGTWMHIAGVFGDWYKVDKDGVSGYVFSDYFSLSGKSAGSIGLTYTNAGNTASTTVSPGQKIVDTAMQYQGVAYVWGGTSPSGFDCSGLVYYCYSQNGCTINRTAASIFENGSYVSYDELQPGDAVCFETYTGYIGHTGIYIGDGKFIHASSSLGYVTVADLTSGYYNTHFAGGRRIV